MGERPESCGPACACSLGGKAPVLIAVAFLIGVVLLARGQRPCSVDPPAAAGAPAGLADTGGDLDPGTARQQPAATLGLPRLVDLGADKCIPCKMMAPILDALREEYRGRLDVVFIDVWKDAAAGERYGIRAIPTQIFYDAEGAELYRHEGFLGREDILTKWQELGVDLGAGPTPAPSAGPAHSEAQPAAVPAG